jgi:ubiquinone/menaquinone biosynthesis C-methylase UbiE
LAARSAPASVSGVDPSEAQIAYARAQSGAKLAEFRVAAAQDLPFADRSFDVATMALVISFVPEPLKAVAEMARVVRGGGLVAAYMWDIPGGGLPVAPMYRVMKATGVMTADPPGADVSRRETMRQVWETAGLQSVETCVIRVPVSYANFDDFWQSNSAPVGPSAQTLKAMAPDAKAELRERVRQSLPTDREGRISYEAFANAVKGRVPQ